MTSQRPLSAAVARVARDRMTVHHVIRALDLPDDEQNNETPDPSGDGPPIEEDE